MKRQRRIRKRYVFRLRLVIDRVLATDRGEPYDVDNAKPWPLGDYATEREAMAARNDMVMISPRSSGDPKRDKKLLG